MRGRGRGREFDSVYFWKRVMDKLLYLGAAAVVVFSHNTMIHLHE